MKKSLLMKTMLLLCCLLVGGSAWATDLITWTARTTSSGSDTYTSGYTYSIQVSHVKNLLR